MFQRLRRVFERNQRVSHTFSCSHEAPFVSAPRWLVTRESLTGCQDNARIAYYPVSLMPFVADAVAM